MAKMSNYLEDEILDHILAVGSWTMPTGILVGLVTTPSSDSARGTEETGTGYSQQTVTFGAASSGAAANTDAVSFLATAGDWGDAVGCFLDSDGTSTPANQFLMHDNDMTDTAVGDGDTLQFAIGDIDVTMD